MDFAEFGLAVRRIAFCRMGMRVRMVAEMQGRRSLFMQAICTRTRPGELQRYDDQQNDEENALHPGMIARR